MQQLKECPICGEGDFFGLKGFDYKPGPEVYEFLGLSGNSSRWTICKYCGFLFQNPRPHPEEINALYQSGLYRQERVYNSHFFKSRYDRTLGHLKWLYGLNIILQNQNVLDIGAGFGVAIRAFLDEGLDAKGVEIDINLCREAKHRYDVDLGCDNISNCQFDRNSFGLIYSAHVHEHFDDFHGINRRLHSWLSPGGYFLCILPTYRYSAKNGQGFINVFHNSIFTKTSLKNMFIKAGFEPIAFHYPMEHSLAEVWGVARKPVSNRTAADHVKLNTDRWFYVLKEIQFGPLLFEAFYKVTRPFWLLYYGIRSLIKGKGGS